jgi:hypothetical protein
VTRSNGTGVIAIFFTRALLCLFPLLALWYWAREWVVIPVAWLAEQAMLFFFSRWVTGSELHGVNQTLLTVLNVPHPSGQVAAIAPGGGIDLLLRLALASGSICCGTRQGLVVEVATVHRRAAALPSLGRLFVVVAASGRAGGRVHPSQNLLQRVGSELDRAWVPVRLFADAHLGAAVAVVVFRAAVCDHCGGGGCNARVGGGARALNLFALQLQQLSHRLFAPNQTAVATVEQHLRNQGLTVLARGWPHALRRRDQRRQVR